LFQLFRLAIKNGLICTTGHWKCISILFYCFFILLSLWIIC